MKIKNKKFSLSKTIVSVLLVMVFVMPFILVISVSLGSDESITKYGYTFFPKSFDISGYKAIMKNPVQLINSYKVTAIYSFASTILSLIVQSMLAYSISRPAMKRKVKNVIIVYMFITMLFHGGLVPSYIVNCKYLKLNDTMWIYILPTLMNVWNVLVIRTFFMGLPDGLTEAAKIDGAGEFRIFTTIVIPLSKPVLATIGFMTLLSRWNDWNTALIYIKKPELYSLQYLLQRILKESEYIKQMAQTAADANVSGMTESTDSMKFAMAILAAGPMLVVFPFFRKYFARGLTVGSVKG